jgi:hypothetical protein
MGITGWFCRCHCLPPGTSVGSAFNSGRQRCTRSSTERSPMTIPCSLAGSWRTTSALPPWRKKRSRSQSSSPSNAVRRTAFAKRNSPALAQIPTHLVARAPEFLRQSLRSPAKLMRPQHRCYLFRLKHLLSPHRSMQESPKSQSSSIPPLITEGVKSPVRPRGQILTSLDKTTRS